MTVIVVAYSITSFESLRAAQGIMSALQTWKCDNKLFLIGLKADLRDLREVSTTVGEEVAGNYGASFKEMSATDSVQVEEFFGGIAELLPTKEKVIKGKQAQELGLWSKIYKFFFRD
jgi:hypothetical protein